MKKKAISLCLVLCLVLLPYFSLVAFCEEEKEAKLSPAFDVIAARQTMVKSGLISEKVQFTQTDFKQCLGISNLEYIEVTKAPNSTDGILTVGSMTVKDGQKIDASLLSMLNFVPASEEIETSSFIFCGDSSTSGAEIKCSLRLGKEVNYAPTIAAVEDSLSLGAESGKALLANLTALDPEGDALTYEIIKYPSNGIVKLTDTALGAFSYTSSSNFSGTDSFEFVARDDWGNYTTPSTVYITVK